MGVDQAHIQITYSGAVLGFIEVRIFPMENRFLECSFAAIAMGRSLSPWAPRCAVSTCMGFRIRPNSSCIMIAVITVVVHSPTRTVIADIYLIVKKDIFASLDTSSTVNVLKHLIGTGAAQSLSHKLPCHFIVHRFI